MIEIIIISEMLDTAIKQDVLFNEKQIEFFEKYLEKLKEKENNEKLSKVLFD